MPRTMKSILRSSRAAARNRRMTPMNRGMAYVQRMRMGNPCTACSSAKNPTVVTGGCIGPTTNPVRSNPTGSGSWGGYHYGSWGGGRSNPTGIGRKPPRPTAADPCGPGRQVCGSSLPGDPPICCTSPTPQPAALLFWRDGSRARPGLRANPSNAGLKYPFGRTLSGAQPTDLKDPFPNPVKHVDPFKLYGTQTIDPFAARRPRGGLAARSNPTGIGQKPPRPNPHGGGGHGGGAWGGRHYGSWGSPAAWGGYGYGWPGAYGYAQPWQYAYAWPYGQTAVVATPPVRRARAVMLPWTSYSPYLGYGMGFQRAVVAV